MKPVPRTQDGWLVAAFRAVIILSVGLWTFPIIWIKAIVPYLVYTEDPWYEAHALRSIVTTVEYQTAAIFCLFCLIAFSVTSRKTHPTMAGWGFALSLVAVLYLMVGPTVVRAN